MKHIPNFITSLNLAAGFLSIIFLLNGDFVTASWLILAAMIFDFFDGFASRLLNAYSEIGKELDSLADLVSFGVAPGIIIYHLLGNALDLSPQNISDLVQFPAILILIIPALIPVCAALRLAKFNIDTTQKTIFRGLPTPANALAIISIVIAGYYSESAILASFTRSPVALIILSLSLSLLMVSRVPLLSLKFSNLKFKGNEGRYILICLSVISVIFLGFEAVSLIIPIYLIVSLLSTLFFPDTRQ
jgi:CDP-diacylglycerol---serine O-phosphatidyltransferase